MTCKLLSLNTHKVNVLNLVPYFLTEQFHKQWYGGCRGFVNTEHPWLSSTSGELELTTLNRFNCGLRSMRWSDNVEFLTECIELATLAGKDLFFGSHYHDQLDFLKTFFSSQSFIIALNYNKNMYEYLLDDLATTHIHSLSTGKIVPNEHDREAMLSKNKTQLTEHYKTIFHDLEYIPQQCTFDGDYEILLDDYLVPSKMEKHFDSIGYDIVSTDNFYRKWFNNVTGATV